MLLFTLLLSCTKDNNDVAETIVYYDQWALVINYTAASCYNCGSWGAPLAHDLEKSDNVVVISVHSLSDPMYTPMMLKFKKDRETGGEIPVFWVGDIKTTDEESTRTAVKILKTNHPLAGLVINDTIIDTIMYVSVRSTFSFDVKADFYLSVFLLEDGIDGSYSSGFYRQIGTLHTYPNDDYTHDFVLRSSSVGAEAYGEKIIKNPNKDQVVANEYIFSIGAFQKDNVYPVAVLWKYDPENEKPFYKFINATKSTSYSSNPLND